MIDITQYLQDIYEDLQRYVDNDVCLCKFKELNFDTYNSLTPNWYYKVLR